MIETIKHLLGLCGEPHLNLFTFIILSALPMVYITLRKKRNINE
jgi:hypothetical protein